MVISKLNGKCKSVLVSTALIGVLVLAQQNLVQAGEMPQGGTVSAGDVTITGTGTDHLIIDSNSQKSIINWNSFSIHSKGRVDFNQPSASSFSLNRVKGSTPSTIAGQLNSNGKVMLVNPNGVVITPSGTVNTRSFTASTLNIKDKDFINERYNFEGNGSSKGVKNAGKITIGGGGHAALLGGYVSNTGVVTAKLGKIALGSGEKITLDFVGDGLMTVSVPSHQLGIIRDINGNTLKSLVTNSGALKANGGVIKLSVATARNLTRSAVNIGSTGSIIAQSIQSKTGRVVIGSPSQGSVRVAGNIDVSAPRTSLSPSGRVVVQGRNVVHSGKIYASGSSGGKVDVISSDSVKLDGSILAKGDVSKGGQVIIISENAIQTSSKTIIDVSGQYKGGQIRALANKTNKISGILSANSDKIGGNIDITAEKVQVASAKIEAKGKNQGGKVRVGGDYLGGNITNLDNNIKQGFVSRFGDQPPIANSKQMVVKADANIDVSSSAGKGGTAVIWSDEMTDFNGTINAKGADISQTASKISNSSHIDSKSDPPNQSVWIDEPLISSVVDPPPPQSYDKGGGFVEISSKDNLKRANVAGVSLNGGTLLLDPRDIYVRDSSLSGYTLTSNLNDVDSFNDGTNALYQVNSSTIETALTAGTNVILQARQDIFVQSDIIATGSSGGDLTLNAGVDINISANITTANGDLNLIANNASITGRGTAHSDVDVTSTLNVGTGDLNITLGNTSSGDSNNVDLDSATISANNITLNDAGPNNSQESRLGNFTASSAINITSTNRSLNVALGSLTANGTGTAINITSKFLNGSGSISTPNGIWRANNTENSFNGSRFAGFTGNFIQYGYSSGDAIQGTGSGLLSAYDPGNLTRIYNVFNLTSYHLTKEYDGTNSTASASFNTSSPSVTGASGAAIPTGLTVTLNSPTFTYDNVNQGNQQVSADAAYTITSKSHTNFTNIFGLSTSATAATLTGRISRKNIQIQG
ncbi:MAG: filamentous hemagglutinin N-terminal domain-containing protein [Alphaproteobacteria bacterium]